MLVGDVGEYAAAVRIDVVAPHRPATVGRDRSHWNFPCKHHGHWLERRGIPPHDEARDALIACERSLRHQSQRLPREALGIEVDFSLPSERIIRALEQIIEWRGRPAAIRCDNGPENISGLMKEYGVKDDSLATHPRKLMLSMTREMSTEERTLIQSHIDDMFGRFKDIVKEGRPYFQQNPDELDKLATGEIFTANKAEKNKLIDKQGFQEDAIDRALELAKLEDRKSTRLNSSHRT